MSSSAVANTSSGVILPVTADEAIPPDAERQFAARMGATTTEVASSLVAMVSHPDEAAAMAVKAAN
jgi:hypothetical protein